MRLSLLSTLLRLADVLDEAHHRTIVYEARTLDLNLESRMHWCAPLITPREVIVEQAQQSNHSGLWIPQRRARRSTAAHSSSAANALGRARVVSTPRSLGGKRTCLAHWLADPGVSVQRVGTDATRGLGARPSRTRGGQQLSAEQSRLDVLRQFDERAHHLMKGYNQLDAERGTLPADQCFDCADGSRVN